MLNMGAQSFTIFMLSYNFNARQSFITNRWFSAGIGAFAAITFLVSVSELIFSCYVHYHYKMSSLQYRYRDI